MEMMVRTAKRDEHVRDLHYFQRLVQRQKPDQQSQDWSQILDGLDKANGDDLDGVVQQKKGYIAKADPDGKNFVLMTAPVRICHSVALSIPRVKIPEMDLIAEGLDEEAGGEDFETRDLAVHMIDILYHDETPSEQKHRLDHEHKAQDLEFLEDPQNSLLLDL
jgi:hypothetical protein